MKFVSLKNKVLINLVNKIHYCEKSIKLEIHPINLNSTRGKHRQNLFNVLVRT